MNWGPKTNEFFVTKTLLNSLRDSTHQRSGPRRGRTDFSVPELEV